jgi:hypothetical protein
MHLVFALERRFELHVAQEGEGNQGNKIATTFNAPPINPDMKSDRGIL